MKSRGEIGPGEEKEKKTEFSDLETFSLTPQDLHTRGAKGFEDSKKKD